MGRTPCCEKKGVKKGSWTAEEDEILISYIQRCGHSNWRALPKQAGLLRCGKSCRLRWNNYLRPDIKRGNFSVDEENTIMKMHEMIGNRWSTIAAKLPGRTDNEIKNHWRSHLKKRLLMISTSKEEAVESSSSMGVKKEAESESEGSINAVRLKDGIQNTVTSVELLNEDFWAEMLSESSLSSEVQVQSSSPSLSDVTTFSHSYWSREDDSLDYYILG